MASSGHITNHAHRFAPAAPDEVYVYGACSPGWHSAADQQTAVDQWITFMQDEGIERVCCLVPGQGPGTEGSNLARYRAAFGPENVCHAPIPYYRLADPITLREEIIPFLDASVAREQPVVVHSLSGLGRTGQVLAAWLVSARDYRPPEAVDTVTEMGRDPLEPVEHGPATWDELLAVLRAVA